MKTRRHIVGCSSCRKRFATSSGSTLCLSCRPATKPPALTYGGNSISISSVGSRKKRSINEVVVTTKEDVPIESSTNHIAVKDGSADTGANRNVDSSGNGSTDSIEAASDTNLSTTGCQNKKRKQFSSSSLKVFEDSCNNLQPCGNIQSCHEDEKDIVENSSMAETSAVAIPKVLHDIQQSNANKQIEDGSDSLQTGISKYHFDITDNSMKSELNDDIDDSCDVSSANDTLGYSKQTSSSPTDEEQMMTFARRPKVSIGSTDNGGCNSSSDSSDEDSEMDVMIAQGSTLWSTNKKCEDDDIHEHSESNLLDDDDSDIVCLGTSSESQQLDEMSHSIEREAGAGNNTSYLQEQPNTSNHEDLNSSSLPAQINSPKKDVCYICGTDLTRIKSGLKGRVAHMKRCSAKYGETLGARRSMNNDGDDTDFVEIGTAKGAATLHEGPVSNPYKQQWHGDASSELALNKAPQSKETQQKSQWKELFKKPVRSLTNVLMSGARQASKVKAITTNSSSASSKSGKKPYRRGQWSSNNSKRTGSCPSFKRISQTDFICDGFQYACKSLSENYFLTHFHSDHYGGIGKTWSEGTIYCSLSTANLVHTQLGVDMKYLHPLPMDTPTVIASRGKPVKVTLLDANHCPGAIMFLFEVNNRKILHVGDFRWNTDIMMQMPQLKAFSNSSPRLDELFLDTTYCNKKYTLPTQEEAISAAIKVADKEVATSKKSKNNKTLFLFGSYTIGKEKIYVSVAEHLKKKVYVDKRRYRILSSLEWPKERMQIFTTDKTETNLWVVPLGTVNFKQMQDHLEESNKSNSKKALTAPYCRVVGFKPTGWTYSGPRDKNQRTLSGQPQPRNLINSKTSGRFTVHGVPYSEHSSFPELVDCLRCLKPKKIIPTVSVSNSEDQVELLLNEL